MIPDVLNHIFSDTTINQEEVLTYEISFEGIVTVSKYRQQMCVSRCAAGVCTTLYLESLHSAVMNLSLRHLP